MRRRKETEKERAERIHAERRFIERVGIDLTQNLHELLVSQIKKGKLKFVERQSVRVTLWETELNGITVHLVYDKKRKQIVTVLPVREESHAQEERASSN
jgi:elongation factor P--beta-lysine ligase